MRCCVCQREIGDERRMLTVEVRIPGRADEWPSGMFTGIAYCLTAECLRAANLEHDARGAGVLD